MSKNDDRILVINGLSKQFGNISALKNVSLNVNRGEILALVGENGAGKSTLIKILSGVYQRDTGEILFNGNPVEIESPRKAEELGIAVIHQEIPMVPYMSVAENFFLGKEPLRGKSGLIDWGTTFREASRSLRLLGVDVDVKARVRDFGLGHQQMVAIARALAQKASLVIMDEPTSSLTGHESERLFETITELKNQGITVIYISHRIEEVFRLSDRIAVLRDGELLDTLDTREANPDQVLKLMVGRQLKERYPKIKTAIGEEILSVNGLTRGKYVRNCTFSAHRGEIAGFFGLVGAGRTELARLIFGADKADSGTVTLAGKLLDLSSPRAVLKAGVCMVPEDRKGEGLILTMSIRENMTLPSLDCFTKYGLLSNKHEHNAVTRMIKNIGVRCSGTDQKAHDLSGGNQQKVVIGKWLLSNFDVIIFDEPTRGIDVGAKVEIYNLISHLVSEGKCVIMISSEIEEILGMCDQIMVMHEGEIVAKFPRGQVTAEKVMHYATGGERIT
jgi:ribose transport system ATP-binding protein